MTGTTCPFCDLEPGSVAHAGQLVVALRDRYPVTPGHTLVIPRRHVPTWFEATPEEQRELWDVVAAVKRQLDAELCPDGYNVGFNAGAAAGQTVMHLHLHVIPRHHGDMDDPRGGVRGVIPSRQKYGDDDPSPDPFAELAAFVPGEEQHLIGPLRRALAAAEEVELVAAFVQPSGLRLLGPDLEDALERGARVSVLTGDYMNTTSADALRALLDLEQRHAGLAVRFYRVEGGRSFHPKAYLFARGRHGIGWVGSSNLSRTALTDGVEWNLRAVARGEALAALRARFARLFRAPEAAPLTRELIEDYERRAPVPLAPEARPAPPPPHGVQGAALEALERLRAQGGRRGLTVLATGLGKTWLAAFDFRQTGGQRALFVAHREEILSQARDAWAQLFPERQVGLLIGSAPKEPDAELLFASVQTLSQPGRLERFAPDAFDYVVIDEFHHAAAATYRRILGHFEPRFLLGLTATPDRMDGASLLELCDGNLVFRAGVVEGIQRRLLAPLRYFGVKDSVDYQPIPWRSSGRFDPDALTEAVATEQRAAQALREYRRHAPAGLRRALAFCCSVPHADHMARYLREHGVEAVAVHSDKRSSAPRAESLRRLAAGTLEVICTVDVFNEGVDLPDVNVVLMLRPTESPIVFLQQLGRGLRLPRDSEKPYLTVVDFIGNHRSFLRKPQALLLLAGRDLPPATAVELIRRGALELPEGCHVEIETEALDMLAALARGSSEDLLLHEYQLLRDSHGRRPSAGELFEAGVHFKPVRERYPTWFDFVAAQGDLSDDEQRVLARHDDWLRDLLTTPMSRSYKMITLRALLDLGGLRSRASVARIAAVAYDRLRADPVLQLELEEHERAGADPAKFEARWRGMPLTVWAGGEGTTRPWFRLEGEDFVSLLEVADEDAAAFEAMTEEMLELRLQERRDRLRGSAAFTPRAGAIRLKVSHANKRPMLFLDRKGHPELPHGLTQVVVDGRPYWLDFVKVAVNTAVEAPGGPNLLPVLLREWYGPFAGWPGTRHRVDLVQDGGRWFLRPDRELRPEAALGSGTQGAVPVRLPYFPQLQVACGRARKQQVTEAARDWYQAHDAALDAHRHFVVQASGDSMDGGEAPIRDGDRVLCEWLTATRPEDVEGQPCLLSAFEGPDLALAQLKVPIRKDGRWWLRSWNQAHPDEALPAGVTLEPVARVLRVLER
ncbi:MAG: DEAD/DEAH box helicase family protein [Planctomycetota bacterium]